MRVGPLFKWFGSKWSSAKHMPKPVFKALTESHAGGAGWALNYSDYQVLLIENNEHLHYLWSWLINVANERLVREIPINIPEGTDIRKLGLSEGQALLLKNWQRTNNVGDCWTISAWGNKPGQWTANTRARVAEEVQAVKHWVIRTSYPWWLDRDRSVLVDPPYLYNYKYRSKPIDYANLAKRVREAQVHNQVIVCEAVCPKTGAVPDYLPFKPSHEQVTSRRKEGNNTHSKELIYTAGPRRNTWVLRPRHLRV